MNNYLMNDIQNLDSTTEKIKKLKFVRPGIEVKIRPPRQTKQDDIKMGMKNEQKILSILQLHFNDNSIANTKTIGKGFYCRYDFVSKKTGHKYEVKSRTNTKGYYNTTIEPTSKINKESIKDGLTFVFFWVCGNVSYITYDEDIFKKFKVKNYKPFNRCSYDQYKPHYEIPIEILKDIN